MAYREQEALDTPFDVDSMLGDGEGPTVGFFRDSRDPQVPRPSPRLGLDIDLSGPPQAGKPISAPDLDTDSSRIDFELSEPADEGPAGSARKK